MAATITFRPTDEQGELIDQMIESGDFANQSEVIRAGIRLLQEQQAKSKLNQLRQLVKEGENSPVVEGWNTGDFVSRSRQS